MARTRSAKGAGADAKAGKSGASTNTNTNATYSLPEPSQNPPRIFVLPKKATPEARIVTIQNPRYSRPTRYLVCPEAGFFEFTRICAPKTSPRSWLIQGKAPKRSEGEQQDGFETQVTSSADLYVASPIDPLFLILPALAGKSSSSHENKKRMFLSSDDYFDAMSDGAGPDSDEEHNHLSEILEWPTTRRLLEQRMAAVCDTVDADDEHMFRLNEGKLLDEMLAKAKRMAEHGLPKSMADKFVTKALEAPILSVRSAAPTAAPKSDDASGSPVNTPGTTTPSLESSADSQSTISSIETSATSFSVASTAATSISSTSNPNNNEITSATTAPPDVIALQAIRVALDFILSAYLPPFLSKQLKGKLSPSTSSSSSASQSFTVDFAPLEAYHAKLVRLRQEAAAARATVDYSRNKRTGGGDGDDEEGDARAEKRRKKEEEDKIKKGGGVSRGVRDLKKVNTAGMRKMSDFFKKKA